MRREEKTVKRPSWARFGDPLLDRVVRDIYDNLLSAQYVESLLEGDRGPAGRPCTTIRDAQTVPAYYDRGDPAAPDWTNLDLIADNQWHPLDLTTVNEAIAEASLVLLRVWIYEDSLHVRKHGNSNIWNEDITVFPPGLSNLLVTPDENGYIDYKLASSTELLAITVRGWWRGYGSTGTGSSSEIALNSAHRLGDGTDHSAVATHAGYLNQAVKTTSSPTFAGLSLSGMSGVLKATDGQVDDGATTDDVAEGSTNLYFTEERANAASDVVAAKAHATGDGTDHSAIASGHPHQNVDTSASPTFAKLTVSGTESTPGLFEGSAAGANCIISVRNTAASSTSNEVSLALAAKTDSATRTTVMFRTSFTNVSDSSRTSRLQIQNAAGGSFGTRLELDGAIFRARNGALMTVLTSNGAPSTTPEAGSLYFDTGTGKLMVHDGSSWVAVH